MSHEQERAKVQKLIDLLVYWGTIPVEYIPVVTSDYIRMCMEEAYSTDGAQFKSGM